MSDTTKRLEEIRKREQTATRSRAGMMRSGTVSRLKPSAPLIAVIGSSWSRGEYPTPSATEYGTSQNEGQVSHKRPTAGTPSLSHWARRWLTATAGDAKASGSRASKGSPGNKAHEGTSFTDAAVRNWPTPTTRDHKGRSMRRDPDHGEALPNTALDGRPGPTTCNHGDECKPTLNPRFVEWLMGFPAEWTDLEV